MTIINSSSITIDTTVPTLSLGQIQLSADRRSTKEAPLTDAQRIRRAVIPATHWGEISATLNGNQSQSLTDVLRSSIQAIASERLRDVLAAEPLTRILPLSDFTVTALLTWNADTASNRGSIAFTRDQVEAWLPTSATLKQFATKHANKPQLATLITYVSNRFAALAAKNHGLKEEGDALKLLALLAPEDSEPSNPQLALVTEIISRLEYIAKSLKAKAAETTISMDDL